jgi:hypothetical protein
MNQELEEGESKSYAKTFNCAVSGCDTVFSSLANKRRHEKAHTNERPFKCQFKDCDKAFARKYDMTVHLRVHTKEKPYTCEIDSCGRKFSRSSSLREHERNIHHISQSSRPKRNPVPSEPIELAPVKLELPALLPPKQETVEDELNKTAVKELVKRFQVASSQYSVVNLSEIIPPLQEASGSQSAASPCPFPEAGPNLYGYDVERPNFFWEDFWGFLSN